MNYYEFFTLIIIINKELLVLIGVILKLILSLSQNYMNTVNVLIFAGTNFRVSMKLNNIRGTNFHGFTSVK